MNIYELLKEKAELPIRLWVHSNLHKDFNTEKTQFVITDEAELTILCRRGKKQNKAIFVCYPSEKLVLRGFKNIDTSKGNEWLFQVSTSWIKTYHGHALKVLQHEASNSNNDISETTIPKEGD